MLELLRSTLVSGTVSAIIVAGIIVILKYGPEAMRTVTRERTRARLVRRALDGTTEEERSRAVRLIELLESRPDKQSGDPPPDAMDGG